MVCSNNLFYATHYVKNVQIRSFSGPYFSAFGLNTDQKNSLFSTYMGKYGPEKLGMRTLFTQRLQYIHLIHRKKIIASLGNFKGTCSEFESWFVFFLLGLFDSLNGLLLVLRWLNHIYLIFQVRLKCWWLSSCICQYHGKNK